ncbi:hypothetical protein [Arvimicrobium flavum]|uniref:hypothetical protein n=1 Tax=Arvimicrobium flavum TaxID=3393320 RepID=UPI00237A75F8|nr:hypothetical protein [Mesorhizobium shangrilense]
MSLPVLIGLIVGGLLVVDILLRFVGKKERALLAGEEDAVAQFRRDYPEVGVEEFGGIVLTRDRRTAFLAMDAGATGFVHGMGDRFVTRQLTSPDVAEVVRDGSDVLTVRFNDVTLRRMHFQFARSEDRDFAAGALQPPSPDAFLPIS